MNFSDRLDSNRQSYSVKEKVYQTEDESLSRKLARLRREAEEIRLELEKRKEGEVNGDEPKDEVGVEDGVDKLSEMLDILHTDFRQTTRTKHTSTAVPLRQLHNAIPSGVDSGREGAREESRKSAPAEAPPGSTSTAVAAFADRLSLLESALGLASMPSTTEATSILPTLTSLSTQITTLSTTLDPSSLQVSSTNTSSSSRSLSASSIPHLDALASRLRNLTSESDKLAVSRKRALEALHELRQARMRSSASFHSASDQLDLREQAALAFEDSSTKIAALYATLPSIQDLQPLLPVVLERLRSLQVLHADAACAKGNMDDVEKQQAATNQEIERWRKGLADVEAKMVDYQMVMDKNTDVVGRMVEDVEERLARLETQ